MGSTWLYLKYLLQPMYPKNRMCTNSEVRVENGKRINSEKVKKNGKRKYK